MKSGPVAITGLRTIVERFDHVLLVNGELCTKARRYFLKPMNAWRG